MSNIVCVSMVNPPHAIGKNIMYLLIRWEGGTGKYLARGHGVRTKPTIQIAKYFPFRT